MTWTLLSLYRFPAKDALTHHQQTGGGTACGRRAPGLRAGTWTLDTSYPLSGNGSTVALDRGRLYRVLMRSMSGGEDVEQLPFLLVTATEHTPRAA